MSAIQPGWANDKLSALIVDDTPASRLYLKHILQAIGITSLFEAENGLAAEQLFIKHKPQIVFLDIQLPDINGNVLLTRLHRYQPSSTFFMVSAFSSVENLKTAIAGGAKGFVVKPFAAERIVKLVQPLMKYAV